MGAIYMMFDLYFFLLFFEGKSIFFFSHMAYLCTVLMKGELIIFLLCAMSALIQEALKALWNAAYPEEELRGLISEQWKEMGWQGKDPSTDFR